MGAFVIRMSSSGQTVSVLGSLEYANFHRFPLISGAIPRCHRLFCCCKTWTVADRLESIHWNIPSVQLVHLFPYQTVQPVWAERDESESREMNYIAWFNQRVEMRTEVNGLRHHPLISVLHSCLRQVKKVVGGFHDKCKPWIIARWFFPFRLYTFLQRGPHRGKLYHRPWP